MTGDNGILTKAKEARIKTEKAEIVEKIQTEILEKQAGNNGDITEKQLNDILQNHGTVTGEGEDKILTTIEKGYEIKVSDIFGKTTVGGSTGVSVSDIFDATGTVEGKLHIGDFINYTAGDWTDGKMSEIAKTGVEANNSINLPTTNFQFGGFTNTSSRDGNATPYDNTYNYVQETKSDGTKQAVTGWRLFDVNDGAITLISAGCPEDYFHPYVSSWIDSAYISEYILTGNINSNADASALELGTTYKVRDWSMYKNSKYKAQTATILTKAKLDEWYNKYQNMTNADTHIYETFQTIYGTKYESLIDNYVYYWLCSAYGNIGVYYIHPASHKEDTYYDRAFGVRVLVSLSSEIKLSEEPNGTKTVTSRNVDYTYNIWNLE